MQPVQNSIQMTTHTLIKRPSHIAHIDVLQNFSFNEPPQVSHQLGSTDMGTGTYTSTGTEKSNFPKMGTAHIRQRKN